MPGGIKDWAAVRSAFSASNVAAMLTVPHATASHHLTLSNLTLIDTACCRERQEAEEAQGGPMG